MQSTTNAAKRRVGILLVLFGAALWGASGVCAQFLFHNKLFSPEWLVVVRLLVSGALLLAYDAVKNRGEIFSIWNIPRARRQLLLFGVFGMLSVQYTYFAAIKFGNAATATILQYLMPVIIVAYYACRGRKWPTLAEQAALILALSGAFLLVTKGDLHRLAISSAALFWGVLSAFSAAFYTVQPKELLKNYRAPLVIGWGMLVGGIAMSPAHAPWKFVGIWDLYAFYGIAFIIVFGTVIAFYAYLESVRRIHPSETGMIASVEPLSAVILSIVFLGTPFGRFDFIGGALILSTVFLLTLRKRA